MGKVLVHIVEFDKHQKFFDELSKKMTFPETFQNKIDKIKSDKVKLTSRNAMLLLMQTLEEQNLMHLMPDYTTSGNGKPMFKGYDFYFNLTHSSKFIALAWCTFAKVGIDIQERRKIHPALIQKVMHPDEITELEQQTTDELFFEYWTRKEAVVKMTGEGISTGIDRVNVMEPTGSYDQFDFHLKKLNIAPNYFGTVACNAQFELEVKFDF